MLDQLAGEAQEDQLHQRELQKPADDVDGDKFGVLLVVASGTLAPEGPETVPDIAVGSGDGEGESLCDPPDPVEVVGQYGRDSNVNEHARKTDHAKFHKLTQARMPYQGCRGGHSVSLPAIIAAALREGRPRMGAN